MTPRRSDHAARSLTATMLSIASPPESSKHWGQVNPNRNDNHCDTIEIGSTIGSSDITDCWHQQTEIHSMYSDVSNVACNIFSIIPYGVGVEASSSLPQHNVFEALGASRSV